MIHQQVEYDNPADYYNCVTPETRVLTHDLQWIPAGDIETGDMLIGVEEDLDSQYSRHLAVGEATVHGRRTDQIYKIRFGDGRVVHCNGEHQWLVKRIGLKGTEWVSTENILAEFSKPTGRPRKWTVMSLCGTWEEDRTYEGGYLAGLLDADGTLGTSQVGVGFAQQDNVVLAGMQRGLKERGFSIGVDAHKSDEQLANTLAKKQVYAMRVRGGLTEQMRALGVLRPPRLMQRWLELVDLGARRLEGRGSGKGKPVRIISIDKVGEGEIVMLGTSCKTYVAEGLVCHNTVMKMGKKRAYVDAIITCTAASDFFDQEEVIDTPELYPDHGGDAPADEPRRQPKAKAKDTGASGTITQGQARIVRKAMGDKNLEDQHICKEFGVKSIEEIPSAKINAVLEWIDSASG